MTFLSQFTMQLTSGAKCCETLKGYGAVGPALDPIIPPKYKRIKQKDRSLKRELSNGSSSSEEEEFEEYSEISSSTTNENDDIIIERMWRLTSINDQHNMVKFF